MATLINNAGVQHYANKMVLAENRKVGSKSLPTALNDIDNLIDEMKTQFDAEYGSALDMKLENNENVFSVGTGTNVDKRSEVENSFTDVELSGNSLVNLFKNFEEKSVNRVTEGENIQLVAFVNPCQCNLIEGEVYTCLLEINNLGDPVKSVYFEYSCEQGWGAGLSYNVTFPEGKTHFKKSFTFKSGLGQMNNFFFGTTSSEIQTINLRAGNIMLLKGDWTNKPIPQYFEGLKSIGEKEDGNHKISISSVGKNLFEPTVSQKSSSITANTQYSIENNGYSISISSSVNRPTTETASHIHFGEVKLKIGETYVVSADKMIKDTNTATPQIRIAYWDKQNNKYASIGYLTNHTSVFTFTVESGKEYVALGLYSHGALLTNGQTVKATYEGVRLYLKSTSNTSYEPHKSDKKEISLNEPLRGLPNGVKDTIEKVNGEWKIVRRCGETILNGNENWSLWSIYGSNIRDDRDVSGFGVKLPLAVSTASTKVICDNFATGGTVFNLDDDSKTNHTYYTKSRELIYCYYANAGTTQMLGISIKNSKLGLDSSNWNTTIALANFKNWLSQNPTKVIYQLDTPIIEDISPVTLQCWKNGTISIDEVLPVESTHTVALNKPAQIKKNIEELTVLRKRVQALEDFYDQVALEQSHQLSLINNSIELDYDI